MVPHRKALRAIALVSRCAPDAGAEVERQCKLHDVKFPGTVEDFWKSEINPWLDPALEVRLLTTDFGTQKDYATVLKAAAQLGVAHVIALTPTGLGLHVASDVLKWRKHASIRVALEVMLLRGVAITQIAEDFRGMYQTDFDESDIKLFSELYCDVEYAAAEFWAFYEECVGVAEAKFKLRLLQQPKDYVRHSLGVAVRLEPDQVLNRLMSDAYFASLKLKADVGDSLSKDELARVKFEQDTIFKAMDRLTKHKEASGGNSVTKAAEAIARIALKYEDYNHPLLSEVENAKENPDAV